MLLNLNELQDKTRILRFSNLQLPSQISPVSANFQLIQF